jgi:SAM-dependent methyltransferase
MDSMPLTENQLATLKRAMPEKGAAPAAARLKGGVIRFREDSGYNDSFALQWTKFQLNQYDAINGTTIYHDRYVRETGWPTKCLNGELMLEAGCGAGAFTCHLAKTGADLVSFDYSAAVDVSAEHNGDGRIVFAQADILDMPFAEGVFDRVFCHGVLQHTPNPELAFKELHKRVRPGGRLSVDIYHRDGKIRPWKSKYIWRPITTRMDQKKLMAFLEWFIPKWLPFDTVIKRIPHLANYLGAIIPCWNYHFTNLPKDQLVQWAIMDTFDALSSAFDKPATMAELKRWFGDCGYLDFEVREGGTGLVGNGVKPGK